MFSYNFFVIASIGISNFEDRAFERFPILHVLMKLSKLSIPIKINFL